ncbi:MAG: hypothetical protein ACLUE8_09440 [Lachnospiraceae bacterium]
MALGQSLATKYLRKVYQTVLTAQQTAARDAVMAGKCCKDI